MQRNWSENICEISEGIANGKIFNKIFTKGKFICFVRVAICEFYVMEITNESS